ncbi:MAG: GrpB family protein [Geodermatophilaceae bacterium]
MTPGSERVGDVITIVDYDPAWPDRFAAWRQVLRAALGTTAVHIEHVGSTSVPGLAAKPIVDVQISVADVANEEAYAPELGAIGLQLRSRDTFHRYFRPFPNVLATSTCTSASWAQNGRLSTCASATISARTPKRAMHTPRPSEPPLRHGLMTVWPTQTPRPRSILNIITQDAAPPTIPRR